MNTTIIDTLISSGYAYKGGGFIGGSGDSAARINNNPSMVRIVVYESGAMIPVKSTRSDSDGMWRVDHLDLGLRFTVIGYDPSRGVNSAIQDWIAPTPMEP